MKNKIIIGMVAVAFVFTMFGVSYAATEWNDDNTFNGIVNWFPNGVKIGQQGTGGVTFFNGSIVNETTNEGVDNPVTFGDNVRIDGEIWRGEESGPGDSMPVKINDDLLMYGDIEGIGLGGDTLQGSLDYLEQGVAKYGAHYDMVSNTIDRNFGTTFVVNRTATGWYIVTVGESLSERYVNVVAAVEAQVPYIITGPPVCAGILNLATDPTGKTLNVHCFSGNPTSATDLNFVITVF